MPALVLAAGFAVAFLVYCGLHLIGRAPDRRGVKHNELFGPFLAGFVGWLISPVERVFVGRVSPNWITLMSVALCAASGIAVAAGHLPRAVWLYLFAGIFDVLDGRVARKLGKLSASGALFDSVSDRWGEWFVFTGYAWVLHDSPWLLAVMAAVGGSMMVSYTRARAEGLGLSLSSGIMQRAERIVLVASGTLAAAIAGGDLVAPILGVTMSACGLAASATALNRWVAAHRALAQRVPVETKAAARVQPVRAKAEARSPKPLTLT
jgi:phosphatidylglycerophosphate synthase